MIKIEPVEPKLLPFREGVNGKRRERGLEIVQLHQQSVEGNVDVVEESDIDEEMIMHVITDLRHLAYSMGLDMYHAVEGSKLDFERETGSK